MKILLFQFVLTTRKICFFLFLNPTVGYKLRIPFPFLIYLNCTPEKENRLRWELSQAAGVECKQNDLFVFSYLVNNRFLLRNVQYNMEGRYRLLRNKLTIELVVSDINTNDILMTVSNFYSFIIICMQSDH